MHPNCVGSTASVAPFTSPQTQLHRESGAAVQDAGLVTRLVALLDSNDPYTLRAAARAVEWLAAYEGNDAHSLMQRPKLRDGLLRLLDPDKCSRVQRAGGKSLRCVAALPS